MSRMNVLSAGLRWLYGTEQPDGALLTHHGLTIPDQTGGRTYWLVPEGADRRPVIVVEVSHPEYLPDTMTPANPLGVHELLDVQADLAVLGVNVARTWNGYPAHSGSLGLVLPAHPSLLAAVNRVRAGCPDHQGQILCSWDGCPWYGDGRRLLVLPTVLEKDTRAAGESTPGRPSKAGAFLAGARNGRAVCGD